MLNPAQEIRQILKKENMTIKDLWKKSKWPTGYSSLQRKITHNKLSAQDFVKLVDALGYEVGIYKKW